MDEFVFLNKTQSQCNDLAESGFTHQPFLILGTHIWPNGQLEQEVGLGKNINGLQLTEGAQHDRPKGP